MSPCTLSFGAGAWCCALWPRLISTRGERCAPGRETGSSSGSRGLYSGSLTRLRTSGLLPLAAMPRLRERELGTGYGFGVFVRGRFAGEINISSVQRGPFQNAYVGYWVDQAMAGHGYTPEAFVVVARFAFEDLMLHRLQVSIIPRNRASHRVAEKLGLRNEGTALRYLEINGVWEDHVRYAITSEDWAERREQFLKDWVVGS